MQQLPTSLLVHFKLIFTACVGQQRHVLHKRETVQGSHERHLSDDVSHEVAQCG